MLTRLEAARLRPTPRPDVTRSRLGSKPVVAMPRLSSEVKKP